MLQTQSSLESAEHTLKYCEELDQVTDRYFVQKVVLKSDTLTVKAQVARARYQIVTLRDALTSQRESLNQLMGRDVWTEFSVQPVAGLTAYETDLDAARARALEERPEVRQARLKAKQASLDYRVQVSKYIPDISLSLNYLSTFNAEFLPRNVASAGVLVNWEPFDWGRKGREAAEKALATQQADYSVREAEQSVLGGRQCPPPQVAAGESPRRGHPSGAGDRERKAPCGDQPVPVESGAAQGRAAGAGGGGRREQSVSAGAPGVLDREG